MSELIISVSGMRGVVGDGLTPEVAARYAAALSAVAPPGAIVLSRDGRASGAMLADAISATLNALGRDVLDAAIAATPTVGVLVRRLKAAGGIQVSASHNPAQYNGLKLFSQEGRVLSAEQGERVLEAYRAGEPRWREASAVGQRRDCRAAAESHLDLVLGRVDVAAIRRRAFRVLLDSNHGAGGVLAPRLLESLGCQVTVLGAKPDGAFEHTPEPTAENLRDLAPQVARLGADVGFCQDPDADRLAIIDASGRYIGEEYTLALCLERVLAKTAGPVVANCATSRMIDDIAARFGVACHRSAVGEANVVDLMLAQNAVFGGEGNGGPIDPQVGLVRDSLVGMALVLDLLAARQTPLAEVVDGLPRYAIHKTTIGLPRERVAEALNALERHFDDARPNRIDGLRLDWDDRWLLVRASNTEPIVRAIAEATTDAHAQALCQQAAEVVAALPAA